MSGRGAPRGGQGDKRGNSGGNNAPRGSPARGGSVPARGTGRGNLRGGTPGGDFRGRGNFRGRDDTQQMTFRPSPLNNEPAGIFLHNEPVPQPDGNVTAAEDERVKATKGRVVDGYPGRPSHGTQGRKIILRANYFHIVSAHENNLPDVVLHRYSVSITESLSKAKSRQLVEAILRQPLFGGVVWASDFRNIIVTTKTVDLGPSGVYQGKVQLVDPTEAPFAPPQATDSPQIQQARARRTKTFKIEQTNSFPLSQLVDSLRASAAGSFFAAKDDIIQLLNIIMAKYANGTPDVYSYSGNKFYPDSGHQLKEEYRLSGGLRALRGYYASVRTSTARILLNLNVSSAAFYQAIPLRSLMDEAIGNRHVPRDIRALTQLEGFLRLLRIKTNYLKAQDNSGRVNVDERGKPVIVSKSKTILGFARHPRFGNAKDVTFSFRANAQAAPRDISVFDYFMEQHDIELQFWQEPVINVGSLKDPMYLPVEVATVAPGQAVKRLLSGPQTAEMIKFAARAPNLNANSIAGTVTPGNGLLLMGLHKDAQDTTVKPFGFEVGNRMITVPGRILASPQIQYRGSLINIKMGSWRMDGKKFFKPGSFKSWAVLILGVEGGGRPTLETTRLESRDGLMLAPDPLISKFATDLKNYGLSMGTLYPSRTEIIKAPIPANRDLVNGVLNDRFEKAAVANVEIMLIIIREADKWLYSRIKFYGDIKHGVQTIVVVGSKFQKVKNQGMFFGNIALKFNIKGGGISHIIPANKMKPLDDRTMLVGIDVTHPSPGSKEGSPSISGVVANVDVHLCQWPGSLRSQTGREEMVEGLTAMMLERLALWQKKNQSLPNKIIVYRDGVSEGQYRLVLKTELPAIQEAFKQLYGPEKTWPKVTIIIVGKRHHTRFYPTKIQDADTRSFNPLPGTVVDRGVTDHFLWDFFLQAHQGLQGTARPAHYVVIMDENGFTQDTLEAFTHQMCYLFNRATKAVSICPPAYYADLLCERGRHYLFSTLNENQGSDGNAATAYNATTAEWTRGVHGNLEEKTFYI